MSDIEELVFNSAGNPACPKCGRLLVWQNDYDIADIIEDISAEFRDAILTDYLCPECGNMYDVVQLEGKQNLLSVCEPTEELHYTQFSKKIFR